MSGKPNRYASDPVKNKDQYMEALALRASIDDMNLQANKTYKATGQLPPVSQMPETRTTTEILADNERLKIALIKDLEPVGDSQFAQYVIQRIQNSPLNITGSLFTYFAQRAPEIVIQLKKLYKYKIRGDSNDVETMASFIEDMFSKTKSMTSSVSSFFTQIENKKHTMSKLKDFEEIYSLFKDIARRISLKAKPSSAIGRKCNDIASGLQLYTQFLSNDQINKIVMIMSNDNAQGYAYKIGTDDKNRLDEYYDVFKRYNEILEQFPSSDRLYTLLQQLDQTIINKNDDLTNRILTEFLGLLNMIGDISDLIIELRRIGDDLHRYYVQPRDLDEEVAEAYFNDPNNPRYEVEEEDNDDNVEDVPLAPAPPPPPPPGPAQPGPRQIALQERIDEVNIAITDLRDENNRKRNTVRDLMTQQQTNIIVNRINRLNDEILDNERGIQMHDQAIQELTTQLNEAIATGEGFKKRRGRPRGCGIVKQKPYSESVKAHTSYDKGIMESPRFVKFGKYLVNNHKLNNDDIFALKHSSGGTIQEFPSVRLSKHLSNVIKKMVGGGVPSYNDLNNLSEPEKVYLHKVAKRSNIVDKFSIPAPDKDQQEKDIHEFEVLKGEIMAGNDSKELIKKFKLHLMKLSKMGSLPKREVSEVMEELIQMGY